MSYKKFKFDWAGTSLRVVKTVFRPESIIEYLVFIPISWLAGYVVDPRYYWMALITPILPFVITVIIIATEYFLEKDAHKYAEEMTGIIVKMVESGDVEGAKKFVENSFKL